MDGFNQIDNIKAWLKLSQSFRNMKIISVCVWEMCKSENQVGLFVIQDPEMEIRVLTY